MLSIFYCHKQIQVEIPIDRIVKVGIPVHGDPNNDINFPISVDTTYGVKNQLLDWRIKFFSSNGQKDLLRFVSGLEKCFSWGSRGGVSRLSGASKSLIMMESSGAMYILSFIETQSTEKKYIFKRLNFYETEDRISYSGCWYSNEMMPKLPNSISEAELKSLWHFSPEKIVNAK